MWWKKEDVYITILKFLKEKELQGGTRDEILDHLKEIHGGDEIEGKRGILSDLIFQASKNTTSGDKHHLSMEAYFNLLEHDELKSARRASLYATIFATLALVVSIFTAGSSIYYSVKQINTPTTISKE